MSKQKIIGIFGCEQTDLCIYLASILENMKNSVLVIDNSFEQKMRFCIPRPNEKMNMITYKNVDYTALCERSLWKTEGYDYVIVNLVSVIGKMRCILWQYLVPLGQRWRWTGNLFYILNIRSVFYSGIFAKVI